MSHIAHTGPSWSHTTCHIVADISTPSVHKNAVKFFYGQILFYISWRRWCSIITKCDMNCFFISCTKSTQLSVSNSLNFVCLTYLQLLRNRLQNTWGKPEKNPVNFKWAHLHFNITRIKLMHSESWWVKLEGLLLEYRVDLRWLKLKYTWQLTPFFSVKLIVNAYVAMHMHWQ